MLLNQVAMKTLWFGMRVDEANNAHRFHHQLVPNEIRVEVGYDQVRQDTLYTQLIYRLLTFLTSPVLLKRSTRPSSLVIEVWIRIGSIGGL